MQPKTATAKRGRTPEEIIAEQKRTHKQATPSVPAKATSDTAVVLPLPDTRTDVQKYLDEVAPANRPWWAGSNFTMTARHRQIA